MVGYLAELGDGDTACLIKSPIEIYTTSTNKLLSGVPYLKQLRPYL